MVVNNWIEANLIWITLSVTILVLVYFAYGIIQAIRKKRRPVSQLNIILLILGLMFLIFLTYHASEIKGKDWGQIILTLGLVIVTALYASSTEKQAVASVKMAEEMKNQAEVAKQQAEASVKMAEEMSKQRYDTVRPVIDIQLEDTADANISAGLAAESGDFTWGLSCKLHNIGLGPAVDIYSYIQFSRERRLFDFGTIATNERTKGEALSVSEEGGRRVLEVYYKDIYDRDFKSSRELQISRPAGLKLGPLKSILVEELPK